MKAAFVALTAAAIRCRQYFQNQEVDHVDAVSAWEWRMLNSLAILAWLRAVLRNELVAGLGFPYGPWPHLLRKSALITPPQVANTGPGF